MPSVPDWVADYIGIPFVGHGRNRDGCDCWGLVRMVLDEQAGVSVPSWSTTYEYPFNGNAVASAIEGVKGIDGWTPVEPGEERLFDVIQMRGYFRVLNKETGLRQLRSADMHTAVVIGPGQLLHIEAGINGSRGDYRRDARYIKRVCGFWRHPRLV